MSKVSRREFLIRAAALAGGVPLVLAACQQPAAQPGAGATPAAGTSKAPAVLKGTSLSILEGTYFVAAAQDLFKQQAEQWGKDNGVSVSVDFLNWPDLQPKIAAAVQAGGTDIVELWPDWQQLYKDNLVDVTPEAEAIGQAGGGYEQYVLNSGPVDGKWYSLPHGGGNNALNYRISYFKEAGVNLPDPAEQAKNGTWPDLTFDDLFAIGKKLKAKGKPLGQALGHSTGDPVGWVYPYMWAYGAMEVDKDGKTILFNKPEFVDGMKKWIQAWKDAFDETGLSWDDSNNNRAFLSDQISATMNGSSIYEAAKKDQPAIANDMNHTLIPKGPAGRFYLLNTRTLAILKKSKNIEGAKAFLTWWFADKQWGDWFHIQKGYQLAATKKWATDSMWTEDPKMSCFREMPKYGRDMGYAGPANEKAALAWSKYIIVDTFAKAVQTGDAQGSINWGTEELKKIYG